MGSRLGLIVMAALWARRAGVLAGLALPLALRLVAWCRVALSACARAWGMALAIATGAWSGLPRGLAACGAAAGGLRSGALTTALAAGRLRAFVGADAVHHFTACGLGGGRHHLAAGWLAQAAPQGLPAHGQRLGLFARLGLKTGDFDFFNVLPGKALNVGHEAFFVQAHKADGFAAVARPAGAANAVHIVFADVGDLVVHHVRQLVNVNAAGGNVGGHQGADIAAFKASQCLRARALAFVAVQCHGRNAVFAQVLGHVVGAKLGACEHQHLAPVALADDVREQGFFLAPAHQVHGLLDALHRGVARRHLNVFGLAQQAVGQIADFVAEGGRKQQRLFLLGHQGQHFFDVVDKAHVQHAVGLVEHQDLDLAQVQRALARVVQQAAGGGHQNVHAAAQLRDLRAHAHAAKHHHGFEVQVLAIGAHAFFHLGGELAGGREDEGAHGVGTPAVFGALAAGEQLQERQRERGRFAGARLGAAQQVSPFEHGRNGLCLNGGGGVVALLKHGFKNGRSQVQFFKGHWESALPGAGFGSSDCVAVARFGRGVKKRRACSGVARILPAEVLMSAATGGRRCVHCGTEPGGCQKSQRSRLPWWPWPPGRAGAGFGESQPKPDMGAAGGTW